MSSPIDIFAKSHPNQDNLSSPNNFATPEPPYAPTTSSDQENCNLEMIPVSPPSLSPLETDLKPYPSPDKPKISNCFNTAEESSHDCPICIEPLDSETRSVITLNCSHKFHLSCIGSALNYAPRPCCPYCRQIVVENWPSKPSDLFEPLPSSCRPIPGHCCLCERKIQINSVRAQLQCKCIYHLECIGKLFNKQDGEMKCISCGHVETNSTWKLPPPSNNNFSPQNGGLLFSLLNDDPRLLSFMGIQDSFLNQTSSSTYFKHFLLLILLANIILIIGLALNIDSWSIELDRMPDSIQNYFYQPFYYIFLGPWVAGAFAFYFSYLENKNPIQSAITHVNNFFTSFTSSNALDHTNTHETQDPSLSNNSELQIIEPEDDAVALEIPTINLQQNGVVSDSFPSSSTASSSSSTVTSSRIGNSSSFEIPQDDISEAGEPRVYRESSMHPDPQLLRILQIYNLLASHRPGPSPVPLNRKSASIQRIILLIIFCILPLLSVTQGWYTLDEICQFELDEALSTIPVFGNVVKARQFNSFFTLHFEYFHPVSKVNLTAWDDFSSNSLSHYLDKDFYQALVSEDLPYPVALRALPKKPFLKHPIWMNYPNPPSMNSTPFSNGTSVKNEDSYSTQMSSVSEINRTLAMCPQFRSIMFMHSFLILTALLTASLLSGALSNSTIFQDRKNRVLILHVVFTSIFSSFTGFIAILLGSIRLFPV